MEPPHLFLCPISMELMEEPVTVSTGVTYDRRSIERWLFTYRKSTCPATMQRLDTFDLTPNHTLKRVISSWLDRASTSSSSSSSTPPSSSNPIDVPPSLSDMLARERLASVLADIEATPFKVTALKNLRSCMAHGDEAMHKEFVASGGIKVLGRIMTQALAESGGDFSAFRPCEEAVAVLVALPLSDEPSVALLLQPECMRPMMALLQRGSAEARLNAMTILGKMSRADRDWITAAGGDVDVDTLKSLLELLSDEVSTKLSSCALDVLLDVVARSRGGGRVKAVEVGAVCVLVELLPDADRHVTERILLLLKRLCECPEGRLAFAEHDLSVAAVSKTMLRVSEVATKLAIKVLWLVCQLLPTEKVLDDMMMTGAVAKLLGLLHVESSPSTKEKAVKMVRVHGGFWRQYPCFPSERKDYLRLIN